MTQDSLEKLADDELRAVIARAETLLTQHDTERKEKALNEARATLAAVGLSLKDLKGRKPVKGAVYHGNRQYHHPQNKELIWKGRGKKPGWLTQLEAEGKAAVEVSNA